VNAMYPAGLRMQTGNEHHRRYYASVFLSMRLTIISTTSISFFILLGFISMFSAYIYAADVMSFKQNQFNNTRPGIYSVGTWLQPRLSLCHGFPAKCARLEGDLSTPDMLLTLTISPQYEEMYPMFSATIRGSVARYWKIRTIIYRQKNTGHTGIS
jgi:hypothetical protein